MTAFLLSLVLHRFPATDGPTTVPLQMISGHWALELKVDSTKKGYFMISTDRRNSIIDRSFLEPDNQSKSEETTEEAHRFDWGNLSLGDVGCVVGIMTGSLREGDKRIVGILGMDVFESRKVLFDYRSGTVSIWSGTTLDSDFPKATDAGIVTSEYKCRIVDNELKADLSSMGLPADANVDTARGGATVNLTLASEKGLRNTLVASTEMPKELFPRFLETKAKGPDHLLFCAPDEKQTYAICVSPYEFHARKIGLDISKGRIWVERGPKEEQDSIAFSQIFGVPLQIKGNQVQIGDYEIRRNCDGTIAKYSGQEVTRIAKISTIRIVSAMRFLTSDSDGVLSQIAVSLNSPFKIETIREGKPFPITVSGVRW